MLFVAVFSTAFTLTPGHAAALTPQEENACNALNGAQYSAYETSGAGIKKETISLNDAQKELWKKCSSSAGGICTLNTGAVPGAKLIHCTLSAGVAAAGNNNAGNAGAAPAAGGATNVDYTQAKDEAACKAINGKWENNTCTNPNGGAGAGKQTSLCGIEGAMAWVACPVTTALSTFARAVNDILQRLLFLPTNDIFGANGPDSNQNSKGFYAAWKVFRNMGIALIIIAGVVMVASHSLGLEFIDAYTIRKLMPRLVVALIGVVLSWPIMSFLITFFNDTGTWIRSILLFPFNGIASEFSKPEHAGVAVFEWMLIPAGMVGGLIGGALLGWVGVLSIIASIAFALLIGLVVLAARQLVIILCLILAPIAIACYVLPGTQKVWNFWKNTTVTSLMMFPIIMGFLAAGEIMARVAGVPGTPQAHLLSLIVFYAPYFMLPYSFKMAGGLMATIFSISNDKSRGIFDRGRKYRGEATKRRKEEYATGANTFGNANSRLNKLVGGYSARTALAQQGGLGLTKRSRGKFGAARMKLEKDAAAKRFEEDGGFALGDTDTAKAASKAHDAQSFLEEYQKLDTKDAAGNTVKHTLEEARAALARAEGSTRTKMGSRAMRLAAMQGQIMDNGGLYDDATGKTRYSDAAQDLASLVEEGQLSVQDAGVMLGKNQNRPDISGLGIGDRMSMVQQALNNRRSGAASGLTSDQEEVFSNKAYAAMRNSGALMAHPRNGRAMASVMSNRTAAALRSEKLDDGNNKGDQYSNVEADAQEAVRLKQYNTVPEARAAISKNIAIDTMAQEYATMMNMQDVMSSAPPQVRERFSHVLLQTHNVSDMSSDVKSALGDLVTNPDGSHRSTVTNQEIMEHMRTNPTLAPLVTARRREYASSADRYRSEEATRLSGQSQPPGGNPAQPTIGPTYP